MSKPKLSGQVSEQMFRLITVFYEIVPVYVGKSSYAFD